MKRRGRTRDMDPRFPAASTSTQCGTPGMPTTGRGRRTGDDRYESGDLIVHFFDWKLIDDLAAGLEVLGAVEFEEGGRRSGRACSRALLLRFRT